MDFDNQSMTLEEAITIIREIDPSAEETNSRRAETLILQAVHQGAEVKFPTDIMDAAPRAAKGGNRMSGIYIPGISMPTNCSECAFCGYYGNGEHMCDIIQKAVEYESAKMSRLDDCPLVPVPEHGDLILPEADKEGEG